MNAKACFIVLIALVFASPAAADSVSLTIVTQKGAAITAQHQWAKRLAKVGIENVRLRSARHGEQPDIHEDDLGRRKLYSVVGVLDRSGKLRLPGETFTERDLAKLKDYLDRVLADGKLGVTAERGSFGLTKDEFEMVFKSLGKELRFGTKDKPLSGLLAGVGQTSGLKIEFDNAIGATLKRLKCRDDLRKLSVGCGAAIALRAEGLALVPEKPRGAPVRLAVRFESDAKEPWPIGWPTKARTSELSPVMLQSINVEIDGFKLTEAVDAIGPRLKMPFLWDHAALAKKRIDPANVEVKLPAARMTYKRILERLLFQARLHGELKIDEAGTVFYWVSR